MGIFSFAAGSACSWASPVIPKLNGNVDPEHNPLPTPLTTDEESWVVGMLPLGATAGPLITGLLIDRIGRKKTLLAFAIPIICSYITLAFVNDVNYFYAARFIMGIGMSCAFSVLPLYVGEIAENHNRGTLGCIGTCTLCFGIIFSYAVGPFVTVSQFCLICAVPPCVFFVVFLLFIPESPYFLVSIGDKEGAEQSLMKLRGRTRNGVEKELLQISSAVEESFANKPAISGLFRSKGFVKGLTVCLGLLIFQQMAGINVVLSYMQSIFDAAGSGIPADISTIIVGVVQLLTVAVTVLVVDTLGRRVLLLISASGSCLSLVSLGTYFYLQTEGHDVSSIFWLPIASLLVYIITFNLGLAPLAWAILGEMFPANVKSLASTIACCTCLILAFATSAFFPYLKLLIGLAQSFWLFGAFSAGCMFFVYFVVPETKGKSLQEIQDMLNKGRKK